jgi:UDP-N-acetylglucosamine--N-acetylmuramyl-(pentapeptide) pyrophosphoryl-undecaprenol N-acetylglucosamine transferase
MRVLLAGGGTAGHIEPAMNLADALRRRDPSMEISAVGTERGLESRLVPERGYPLHLIPAVPLPRKPSIDLISLPFRLRNAIRACCKIIDETKPDVIVGFGGFVALPAYLAARRANIPVVVHEANAKAGLANRIGARSAKARAENVAGSLSDATRVGIPLRRSVSTLDRRALRDEALAHFGINGDRPVLLVFGGSQGAQRINSAVWAALPALLEAEVTVIHGVGQRNADAAPAGVAERYVPLAYIDRMDLAYAVADLALCRSGAMTCAELAAVGVPAIYVPLAIGNGEQRLNATPVVAAGGGLIVEDPSLNGEIVITEILPLLGDGARLATMGSAAAIWGVRDADELLADIVVRVAAEGP